MEFKWDENKAATNLSKHEISFDEAKTVFDDPLYVDFYDPDHSYNEHRYIIKRTIATESFIDRVVYGTRKCDSFD